MRIGILGGTFDPIHTGHIYLAERVLKELSLENIIFIPAYIPPHKEGEEITATEHRYNMVRLALHDRGKFKISDIEIKRKGRSYTVETLRQLKDIYGNDADFFFIAGSDQVAELDKWKDMDEVLKLCHFVVVKRPAFPMREVDREFIILDIDAKDISSSEIRERVKDGQSIKDMVPAKVEEYIKQHNLYKV